MKVLVIPEDPVRDQYILKPIVEKLFADLGKRSTRVEVLRRPRLRGVAQALDASILSDIVATYPMNDFFLVLVDRDGRTDRSATAQAREAEHPGRLFVCLAIEEIETWLLSLHVQLLPASWSEIRKEKNVKVRFAQPFLQKKAPKMDLGDGRAWAMRGLGSQWRGVLERCPELQELRDRLGHQFDRTAP